jgi:WD40 repeat protein
LALAFSPNGQYLASAGAEGSLDNNIRIWDIASRQLLQTFSGPAAAVSMLGFDASSTILIAGSKDRAVRFFERGSGRVLATRQPFNSRPVSLALPPKQERNVLLATSNGELAGYELPPLPPPLSRNHRLRHASFSPNGRYLATSTHRGAIELIETETGRLLLSSEGNGTDRPVSVDDQGRLLWAEPDGVVRIQESNGVESSFSAGARPLPVLLSPVKPLVLLWQNQQKNLEAWENGLMKWSREDPASTIRASFSPDGSRVAMVTEDLLSILDTETGAVQGLVTEIEGRQLVDWSEDGKLVAVSTEDFAIQLIDTMRYLPVLKTQVHHQDHIFQGCFFESSFVSSSRDWTIKIWSRSTGALQATIPTGTMDIVWLSCNQERQQVLGLSTDGQLIELDLARLMLPSSELQRLLAHQHALELSDSWEDIPWRPLNNQPVLRE